MCMYFVYAVHFGYREYSAIMQIKTEVSVELDCSLLVEHSGKFSSILVHGKYFYLM